MAESGRRWVRAGVPVLVFLVTLPGSFFVGITFILGHARVLPYVSVWVDRLVFGAVVLGIPSLAALTAYLIATRRHAADTPVKRNSSCPQ